MHYIGAVGNAFVGFALAFVLLEDALVSNVPAQDYALPCGESLDTAATLVDPDFDTREPCSDHHVADWGQSYAWPDQASSLFVESTVLGILCLFLHGLGIPLADLVPYQGCQHRHERTEKIRVAYVPVSDWV